MARKPRPIATIDCETDPFKFGRVPLPFLWMIYDGETYYEFEHVSDAIHFLKDKKWIVYAHNGGKFDYHMPGFLKEMEGGSKIMVINGRLAKFKIGECEFRDSYNLLPIPLSAYEKDAIDYEWFEKGVRKKHMAKIVHYCKMDCKYLYDLVKAFREEYGDGLTLAGSAMKVWQNRFDAPVPHSSAGFYDRIAPFYYGGRVQCFETGIIKEPFTLYDINSAYPEAMLYDHPLSTEFSMVECGSGEKVIPHSFYIVDAKPNGAFPARAKNALEFPNGRMARYFVTGWELQSAIDTGSVGKFSVYARLDFSETMNFKPYVQYFYEMKKEAKEKKDKERYLFAKLMQNSLYGKYGSNPRNYGDYSITESRFINVERHEMGKEYAGQLGPWAVMRSDLPEEKMHFYNVATAASITGFVRAKLWRQICAIKKSGNRVLYCDTDSIAATGGVPAGMKIGKELGEWGNDGNFTMAAIAGKKLYAFKKKDGTWKSGCKGVRISPEEIVKVAAGGTVEYKRDAPSFGIRGGEIQGPRFVTRQVRITTNL